MTAVPGFGKETAELLRDSGVHFIITGATGWLGRASIGMLSAALGAEFSRRVRCYGSRSQNMRLSADQDIPVKPLAALADAPCEGATVILHYAFLTKDKVTTLSEPEYVKQNRDISRHVADRVMQGTVRGLLIASSGAVYDYQRNSTRDESANLYGQLKSEDEQLFSDLCKTSGVPVIIPRIFNIAGPYINKYRAYALSSIIDDIYHGRQIQLNATQQVLRSYVSVADVIEICVRWLLEQKGAQRLVFDAAGEEVIEIGDLALRIRTLLGAPRVPIVRPPLKPGQENRYVGDGTMLRTLARQYHRSMVGLDEQILSTAEYIKANPQ